MKKFFLIISLLSAFFVNDAVAACKGASPTWNCTADSTSAQIQSCINSASPGDTINIAAGSGTWSNITINKGLNIIGAGIGNTVITAGSCGLGGENQFIVYNPSNFNINTPFRLSGFSFNLNGSCGGLGIGGESKIAPFTIQTSVRVDHNRFYNPGSGGFAKLIWHFGIAYGVIDHNIFEGSGYSWKNDPGVPESYNWWNKSPQKDFESGSKKYLYFENNTVYIPDLGTDVLLAECQWAGRYAMRYNTINLVNDSWSLFEMHGANNSMPSCFGAEVYGNRINSVSGKGVSFFKTRGGKSFIFNNSVSNGSGHFNNTAYDGASAPTSCASSEYNPVGQMIHENYWWNSRREYTGSLAPASMDNPNNISCAGLSGIPMGGRDVFSEATSPGVSAGTLANRPISCTKGQGYWATNQPTADLTNMVGVEPSNPAYGTLYRCTVTGNPGTWEAFYTPYTYPHPLTTGGTPLAKKPYPPTILEIK